MGEVDQGWNVAKAVLGNERLFLGGAYAAADRDRSPGAARRGSRRVRRSRVPLPLRQAPSSTSTILVRPTSASRRSFAAATKLGADVSILKIFTTELYQRISEETLALGGRGGALRRRSRRRWKGKVDAMNIFLDARAPAIFGGSNEIQKNILAKAVLGLPG